MLTRMGYLPKIISTVKAFYNNVKVRISVNGKLTASIAYNSGVKDVQMVSGSTFNQMVTCSICHDYAHIASVLQLSSMNCSTLMIVQM